MRKRLKDSPAKPTDLRAQRRREQQRLFWAVAIFLVIGGGASIALAYGSRAIVLGVICLLAGAGMLGLLWLILTVMERLVK